MHQASPDAIKASLRRHRATGIFASSGCRFRLYVNERPAQPLQVKLLTATFITSSAQAAQHSISRYQVTSTYISSATMLRNVSMRHFAFTAGCGTISRRCRWVTYKVNNSARLKASTTPSGLCLPALTGQHHDTTRPHTYASCVRHENDRDLVVL
jgi:hypothetical protein